MSTAVKADNETKRQRLESLRSQLEQERQSFIPTWREGGENILARRPRFMVEDVNRGERRNKNIIDSTATLSARTLRSGMMGGVTSPARPWFRLSTPNPGLSQVASVKDWLHDVGQVMSTIFLKSNLYNVLPILYGDLGVFGTAAIYMEEDLEDVVRFYAFPIGSYCIGNDHRGKVNIFTRDFRMTVRQIVQKFAKRNEATGEIDWTNISDHVRDQYNNGRLERWVDICHVIKPNDEYVEGHFASKHKRFMSVYYERGKYGTKGYQSGPAVLSEKGYDFFPVMAPRWEVTGEDSYGSSCPGIDAMGDILALQLMQERLAEAIEKMVRPPMQGPTSLMNSGASILPGGTTWYDSRDGGSQFKPTFQIEPKVQELMSAITAHQDRIRRAFYEDLFLMLANSDRREITATEIDERKEEKLLALGPVLEQLNQDLLDPLIDNTFQFMLIRSIDKDGNQLPGALIPPPPQEIQGAPIRVEYISVMAQAQKLVGVSSIDRFLSFIMNVNQAHPEVFDKVDIDQMTDDYGESCGVSPRVVRTNDDANAIRKNRNQAAQAQQQAEMLNQGANAAKTLSQADTQSPNALTALLDQAKAGQLAQVTP